MKIKQKLKKLQITILLIIILSSYIIIIPNKVYAKETKYYFYSKSNSVQAVGNDLKGKYLGAPVKTIKLVKTEYKYKTTKKTSINKTSTISGYTYSGALSLLERTTYNGYPIVSKKMNPSVYNYGANEYKQYKVTYTYKVSEEQATVSDWTTEKRSGEIVDTRYYYEIITTQESKEILKDENGNKYIKTSGLGDGTILEKTYIKDNGETDYIKKYNKDGMLEEKIEYANENKKTREIKYYPYDPRYPEDIATKELEVVYDNNGKWYEKIFYIEPIAAKSKNQEYFRIINKGEDGLLDFKVSNGQENVTFTVTESKQEGEAPIVSLGWRQEKFDTGEGEFTILYRVDKGEADYEIYGVDDFDAYKKGQACKMVVRKGNKYVDRDGELFIYRANKVEENGKTALNLDLWKYKQKGTVDNSESTYWKSAITYNNLLDQEQGYITYYNEDGSKKLTMDLETLEKINNNNQKENDDTKENNNVKLNEIAKAYKSLVEKMIENVKETNEMVDKSNEIINKYNDNVKEDTNQRIENTIEETGLLKGDILKFNGYAWNLRDISSRKTIGKYITNGNTFELLDIDGEYLKIKMLSGEYTNQEYYIVYGTDAVNYFEKVSAISAGSGDSNSKMLGTIDSNTTNELIQKLFRRIYLNYFNKTEAELNELMKSEMITTYVEDIKNTKITICDAISKIFTEDVIFDNSISDAEFVKRLYKTFTLKELIEEEINVYVNRIVSTKDDRMSRSEVLESILLSNDFKNLCKEYGIDESIIGTYIPIKLSGSINKEKVTSFINDIYNVANIPVKDEEKEKIINNIVNSKSSGCKIVKTIIESDEFKNLELSDEEYIKIISKICLDENLSNEEINKYAEQLISGTNRNELLKAFMNNNKFTEKCKKYEITKGEYTASPIVSTNQLVDKYIKNAYEQLINKSSDNLGNIKQEVAIGKTTVTKMLQTFIESNAFKNRNLNDEDYIQCLFKAILNREASNEEKETYKKKLGSTTKENIVKDILETKEFKQICNKYYIVSDGTLELVQENEKQQNEKNGKVIIKRNEKTTKDGKKIVYLEDVVFDLSAKTKGDVNGDGKVGIEDASYVLTKTVAVLLNDVELSEDELKYVDIDGDNMITVEDAKYILEYYAKQGAGLKPTWEDVIHGTDNPKN